MSLPSIIVDGRLVEDPTLVFTPSGVQVCNLRIAANRKERDENSGKWVDTEVCYLRASVWRDMAENVAESLRKGDEVLLWGDLRSVQVTNQDGSQQWVNEIYVTRAIGPSLRFRKTPHSRDVERAKPRSEEST